MRLKLDVPLVKQKPGSVSCGIISVFMVLKYLGYSTSLKDLFAAIKLHRKRGTIGPVIVEGLKSLGIDSELLIYAPHIFTSLDEKELRKVISRHGRKFTGIYARKLLKVREKARIKKIDSKLIIKLLEERRPPIIAINSAVFRGKAYGKYVGHYVVVSGYEDDYFVVNDPHWKFGGILEVPRDVLIASIYSARIPEVVVAR